MEHGGESQEVGHGRRAASLLAVVRFAAPAAAVMLFGLWFKPGEPQSIVDGLWVLAVVLWAAAIRHASGGRLLRGRVEPWDVGAIVGFLGLFAAAWLPFYNNWRWAYTGDSLACYVVAAAAARAPRLPCNLLSIHGPDDNATYVSALVSNLPVFIFGPSFFWHRVGKLIVSAMSLAAIYTYFTVTLRRRWALLIVACVASNYVWLRQSFISDQLIESYICAYLTLAVLVLIWRDPEPLAGWMLCGLIGGMSLFLPQTAWSTVAAVGVLLGIRALVTRRLDHAAVYGISFVLAGLPLLLQLPDLVGMSARQAQVVLTWEYIVRIFAAILRLPFFSAIYTCGAHGAILRWPLGWWYIGGVVLAVLAVVPAARRVLRIPSVAPLLLALLLWEAVLLTLTNNAYGEPSIKRAPHLIPLQVFLALLPGYVLLAWAGERAWLRRGVAALLAGGVAVYAAANFLLIAYPAPGMYGFNVLDGLIELRQRFPERRVLLAATREVYQIALAPDEVFNQAYHLLDRVTLETTITDDVIDRACAQHMLFCYEPNKDRERIDPLLERYGDALKPFPLLNANEMVCYDCVLPHAVATR